jgi:hypothetical protein
VTRLLLVSLLLTAIQFALIGGTVHMLDNGSAPAARVAAPTDAKVRGQRFAVKLLARWNAVAGSQHGFPADLAFCMPYGPGEGEAVYSCAWRFWDVRRHRYWCRADVIATSFLEFSARFIPCTGRLAPPARTGAA